MTREKENREDTLNPEIMRERLISVSMYITAFELLKDTIIENIRSFYMDGYDSNGPIIGKDYQNEVLEKNKSEVYACLEWLVENNAIDRDDVESFERIKKVRNRLVHEIQDLFTKGETFNLVEEFNPLINLLRKIGVWWVVNVEIPINSDYAYEEIDESEVMPGAIISLQIMLEVVSGNTTLLETYRKAKNQKNNI